jgi:hypothetical protein
MVKPIAKLSFTKSPVSKLNRTFAVMSLSIFNRVKLKFEDAPRVNLPFSVWATKLVDMNNNNKKYLFMIVVDLVTQK